MIVYGAWYLIKIINDYVTGLCTYYTILFIVILECTLSTYKKFAVKQYAVLYLQQPQASGVYCFS